MNAKLLLTGCLLLLLSVKSAAQYKNPYARAGINLFVSWLTHNDDKVILVPALSFSLGVKLVQTRNFAISVTAPISAGASAKSNTYFGFDLPAMLEVHLFSATGNNANISLGCLLGAGIAYNYSGNYWDDRYDRIQSDFWGYRFHAGVSFGKDPLGNRSLVLLSYGVGMTDKRKNLIAIGFHYIIGYGN